MVLNKEKTEKLTSMVLGAGSDNKTRQKLKYVLWTIVLNANNKGVLATNYVDFCDQIPMSKQEFSRLSGNLEKLGLLTKRKIYNTEGRIDHHLFELNLEALFG